MTQLGFKHTVEQSVFLRPFQNRRIALSSRCSAGTLAPIQCVSSYHRKPLERSSRRVLKAKRYFHSLWNESNISVLEEIASEDVVHSDRVWCEYELVGLGRVRKLYESYMAGYPDCHFDIKAIGAAEELDELQSDAKSVIVHWHFRGTNLGELWDAPATGRHTEYSGVHILHFDEQDQINHVECYRQPSEEERRQLFFEWD
mmetsp:Transcript_42885/g.101814  ORF Transcript_42885/g.101814 Transcript_42885/m.101814 type:complete len:201 (-) Transcript_42885:15-617(-)